jgi:1,4-dihydroxy-2-naphthoate polyprenyltransferase
MKTWIIASRPKTLPAALVPVIMGGVMAYGDGVFHPLAALVALICALLIQVATNFVNDYADFKKGTDDGKRIGPLRVTQAGLVTPLQMKRAIWFTFGITVLLSLYLVYRGGWPIVVIGTLSIVSGIMYTAGPYPLGYLGLGDLFVLVFFGPVAVAGTYYVQALTVNWIVILSGFGPGLISVAILTVNNLRDVDGDSKSGKNTLAVRFGKHFAMKEYYYSLLTAAVLPVIIYLVSGDYKFTCLTLALLLFIPGVLRVVHSQSDGPSLNRALGTTGKLLLIYGILFSLGWLLSTGIKG